MFGILIFASLVSWGARTRDHCVVVALSDRHKLFAEFIQFVAQPSPIPSACFFQSKAPQAQELYFESLDLPGV
jgi:hypothetical protein